MSAILDLSERSGSFLFIIFVSFLLTHVDFGWYINELRVISLSKNLGVIKYLLRIEHLPTFSITASLPVSETLPRSYDDGSFTQYVFHLHKFKYDWRETKIRMQIRTRDPDGGVLMFNAGSQEGRYSLLEVQVLYFLEWLTILTSSSILVLAYLSKKIRVQFRYKIEQYFIAFVLGKSAVGKP